MNHDTYPADYTTNLLAKMRTIALVGASANAARPSHGVMAFLLARGFEVFPVNPGLAGQQLLGRTVYASLADVPAAIDMVDIFRNSDDAARVVDDALALEKLPKLIWMQLGVRNDAAAARAEAKGISVVMDRCPAIELNH
jgi:uncharacterized protein